LKGLEAKHKEKIYRSNSEELEYDRDVSYKSRSDLFLWFIYNLFI